MTPLDECCYRCRECQRVVCTDNESSPGEPIRCADCTADWVREGWAS